MQEKNTKRKQNIWLLIAIGLALVLAGSVQFYFYKSTEDVNIEVAQLVGKYNKNCPLTIQPGMRLDSVNLPEKNVVQYNLTLINVEKKTAELNLIAKEIGKSIINTAKANPGLEVFRDNDYTLIYKYSDKNKVFMFDVKAQPDQYK
ncbi:hypothetical protein EV144_107102 [Flavobacterium sp. 270]|nr:hypothetical protein EV144_107102 [Flavobacterium sp. 270]